MVVGLIYFKIAIGTCACICSYLEHALVLGVNVLGNVML
jgi:hypothetical protein